MRYAALIADYAAGPSLLRQVTQDLTRDQLLARPIPGKWSTLEVVAHLADFEIISADRMKRVIAENEPTMFGGDPDVFIARLAYHTRELEDELRLIETVRAHVTRILATLPDSEFGRIGIHSEAGPLTLASLLQRATNHLPHHGKFIEAKRAALGL